MGTRDARVDAYIAKSADFAKPILKQIRKVVHAGCPAAEETIKWGVPTFLHKGLLCMMAAFKAHCTFGFWKHKLIFANDRHAKERANEAMGSFGRITSLADLPEERVLLSWVKEAVRLNEEGIKVPRRRRKPTKQLIVPDYFLAALRKNKKALASFEGFTYTHKKEYVEWITEAKREETRRQRLKTAVAWLAEGKPRNWKYMR